MKYSIYQIKEDNYETCSYLLRSYDPTKFDFLDYEYVYSGSINHESTDIETLEKIFRIFNIEHPADYDGRSLSVSDIICLKSDEPVYYYCNSVGWKALPLSVIVGD